MMVRYCHICLPNVLFDFAFFQQMLIEHLRRVLNWCGILQWIIRKQKSFPFQTLLCRRERVGNVISLWECAFTPNRRYFSFHVEASPLGFFFFFTSTQNFSVPWPWFLVIVHVHRHSRQSQTFLFLLALTFKTLASMPTYADVCLYRGAHLYSNVILLFC